MTMMKPPTGQFEYNLSQRDGDFFLFSNIFNRNEHVGPSSLSIFAFRPEWIFQQVDILCFDILFGAT